MAKEQVDFQVDGNAATLDVKSKQPMTLEDALKKFEVDTAIWDVERYTINQWDQGMKGPDNTPLKVELYQVKIYLKRKIAVLTSLPALSSVNVNISSVIIPRKRPSEKKIKTCVIIPDSQNGYQWDRNRTSLVPFHDRRCWDLGRQLVEELKPDDLVFLGDMIDLPEWSDKFYRSPDFYFTTQPALLELAWWLGRYREASPKSIMSLIEGNHEFRFDKAVGTHLPFAYGLRAVDDIDEMPVLSIEKLLGLKSLKISYRGPYPYGELWLNDRLCLSHGTYVGKQALLNMSNAFLYSNVVGHLHRQELVSKTVYAAGGPQIIQVCCPGTFAKLDGSVPSSNAKENWQQGLLVVHYEADGTWYHLDPVLIHEGEMFYGGKIYHADVNLQRLRRETKWESF